MLDSGVQPLVIPGLVCRSPANHRSCDMYALAYQTLELNSLDLDTVHSTIYSKTWNPSDNFFKDFVFLTSSS